MRTFRTWTSSQVLNTDFIICES